MRRQSVSVVLFCLLLSVSLSAQGQANKGVPTDLGRKLADNYMTLHPSWIEYSSTATTPYWVYEYGLMLEAFYQVWKSTGDVKYYNYVKSNIDKLVDANGNISGYSSSGSGYKLDDICPGKALMELYIETTAAKYKTAATKLRTQLTNQPRTASGGFWHKQTYPNQMWLDGLYMAEPFYLLYATTFGDTAAITDVTKQFLLIKQHLKDSTTGLYYHGWDESKTQTWSNPVTGTSKSFWGRAIGWYMMGLVDILDFLPQTNPHRAELIQSYADLAASMLKFRDAKQKLWYQVVDKGTVAGNYIEGSVSSMMTYCYFKGAAKGYLSADYTAIAKESLQAIMDSLVTTDSKGVMTLQHVCQTAGLGGSSNRDGTFAYYISEAQRANDFKGYGPLMMASLYSDLTDVHRSASRSELSLELKQNYPNPFNPSTTISYSLPHSSMVIAKIYDMLGNEIATLSNTVQQAGVHQVSWNASTAPSGVYIFRLNAEGQTKQQKMLLLK